MVVFPAFWFDSLVIEFNGIHQIWTIFQPFLSNTCLVPTLLLSSSFGLPGSFLNSPEWADSATWARLSERDQTILGPAFLSLDAIWDDRTSQGAPKLESRGGTVVLSLVFMARLGSNPGKLNLLIASVGLCRICFVGLREMCHQNGGKHTSFRWQILWGPVHVFHKQLREIDF